MLGDGADKYSCEHVLNLNCIRSVRHIRLRQGAPKGIENVNKYIHTLYIPTTNQASL